MGSLYFYATPQLAHQQKGKKGHKRVIKGQKSCDVLNMTFGTFRTLGTLRTLRSLGTLGTFRTLRTLRIIVIVP